jgi:hypothetical protein
VSVRSDLSVNWNVSPRIITVLKNGAASEAISLQDLIDTLRSIEYQPDTMAYPYLIDSFGKQALGGGVLVGITLVLKNAKLAFEARGGPTFAQCNISGGNLVAVDANGNDMDAVETTAYTQIIKTSSSSATLQELQDIQYASFNGGVTIDVLSSYSGITYPVGTPRQPVNNLADAMIIAAERGFTTLFIIGNITIDSSGDYTGMRFVGENPSKSILTVASAAVVLGCEFRDGLLGGVLDGNARVECCIVDDLSYVYGCIYNSVLKGKVTLDGNNPAIIVDCRCYPQTEIAEIDMGGSGQDLGVRDFNGKIRIKNLTGANTATLDMNSGEIILDSTCTTGTIICRGIAKLTDNSNGSIVINELLSVTTIWAALRSENIVIGSMGEAMALLWNEAGGKRIIDEGAKQEIFYEADNITEVMRFNLFDKDGNPATKNVFERVRV